MSSACKQLFANILHFAFDEALRPSIADDPRYTANPCTNPTVFFSRKKHGSVKSCTVPFPSQVGGSRAFLALEFGPPELPTWSTMLHGVPFTTGCLLVLPVPFGHGTGSGP